MPFIKDNLHLIDNAFGEIIASERKGSKNPKLVTHLHTYYRKDNELSDGKFKWKCKSCPTCVYTSSNETGRVRILGHNGEFHKCKNDIKNESSKDEMTEKCENDVNSVAKLPSLTSEELKQLDLDYVGPLTDIEYCEEMLCERQRKIYNLVRIIQDYMEERTKVVQQFNEINYYFKHSPTSLKSATRTLKIEKDYLTALNVLFETNFQINQEFFIHPDAKFTPADIVSLSKKILKLKEVKRDVNQSINILCSMNIDDFQDVGIEYEMIELKGMFKDIEQQKNLTIMEQQEPALHKVMKNATEMINVIYSIAKAVVKERERIMCVIESGLNEAKITKNYIEILELAKCDVQNALIFEDKCIPNIEYLTGEQYDSSNFAAILMETENVAMIINKLQYFIKKNFNADYEEQLEKTIKTTF